MSRINYYLYKYRGRAKITVILIICLLLPVELYSFYNLRYISRIFPNIYVNDLQIGGKNKQEAIKIVNNQQTKVPPTLDLKYNGQAYTLQTSSVDIKIDPEKTIQTAYDIGRLDTIIGNLRVRTDLLFNSKTIPLRLTWKDDQLKYSVASIAAILDEPDIPPTLNIINYNGEKTATISAGKQGRQLDQKLLYDQILTNIAYSQLNEINLPIVNNSKVVTAEKLEQTRKLAQSLLNKTLTLKYQDNNWDLDDESLINFLSIYDTFDQEKIASWSGLLSNTINRPPQNALFNWDGQRVNEFKPAKPGLTLDVNKTIESIKNGINFLANNQESNYTLEVFVEESQPKITNDKVNDLGIKELIGTGESWFYHSIATRIHNLTLASSKFHGILIPPGEEFSMLKILGNIDASQGYKPAYIIQNGRTILGDGGGVCQTSTTMFRAALDAGVNITERHPHAYRVSYYENNFDVGVDASVFSPTADFKFINDTPEYILIQVTIDPKEMYLRYDFYGTSDGRNVERSKSRIWDQSPPPPDLYQDDPTLPNGTIKQVDWAAWGAKTAFDWKVTRSDEVIHEKTFYSAYRPWQAVYLKGVAQ